MFPNESSVDLNYSSNLIGSILSTSLIKDLGLILGTKILKTENPISSELKNTITSFIFSISH